MPLVLNKLKDPLGHNPSQSVPTFRPTFRPTIDVRSIPLSVCNKTSEANTTPGVRGKPGGACFCFCVLCWLQVRWALCHKGHITDTEEPYSQEARIFFTFLLGWWHMQNTWVPFASQIRTVVLQPSFRTMLHLVHVSCMCSDHTNITNVWSLEHDDQ